MSAICLDSINKSYKSLFHRSKALKSISLNIKKGEVFGIIGPNGAGKTTLISLILDFLKPDEGSIRIFDESPAAATRKYLFGYLPESYTIFKDYKVEELIKFHTRLVGMEYDIEIDTVLTEVGLSSDIANKRLNTLSKGMLQRLLFAIAFLGNPRMLILDEPTASLAPEGIISMRKLILDENKKGTTILMSSHILTEVERLCDRVCFIKDGEIVDIFTVKEIKGSLEDYYMELIET